MAYEFPTDGVGRILVLRTAPMAVVERAIETLRMRYPEATFGILGTNLVASRCFTGMALFEIHRAWLTPQSYRPLRKRVSRSDFDMVVMCMNDDCGSGYANASRVLGKIPARHRAVVSLSGEWRVWNHLDFETGNRFVRALINVAGWGIYPFTLAALSMMPSRPRYMPGGQGRRAPEYES